MRLVLILVLLYSVGCATLGRGLAGAGNSLKQDNRQVYNPNDCKADVFGNVTCERN